jgi:hypothetical protein
MGNKFYDSINYMLSVGKLKSLRMKVFDEIN